MTDSLEPGPTSHPLASAGGPPTQLVSDVERDQTVTLLREHVVVGRLTLDEFSERVGAALEARTRDDLSALMVDLPLLPTPVEESDRRRARRRFVAVMSGAEAKGRWRVGPRTTAVAVMGGCDIDLRRAEIDGPEVVITAVAFWGGICIVVPEGFDVELEGLSLMGGRNLELRDVPRVPGSPRIRVRGFAIMGGIDVKSRPPGSRRAWGRTVIDEVLEAPPSQTVGTDLPPIDLRALDRDLKEQARAARRADRRGGEGGSPEVQGATRRPPAVSEGTVTILFTDMVDYAGMTERLGDQASRRLLQDHHEIVRGLLRTHGGREIKVQGDGFMVAFGGVARALRCAADMQRGFSAYSAAHPDRPIAVHIGIHTGEAFEEGDDFLGHTVIVASRIADIATSGEVLVSSLSAQMVERTEEFSFVRPREVELKGLSRLQSVVTLDWAD